MKIGIVYNESLDKNKLVREIQILDDLIEDLHETLNSTQNSCRGNEVQSRLSMSIFQRDQYDDQLHNLKTLCIMGGRVSSDRNA